MSKHLAFEYKMKLIENTLKAKMEDMVNGFESMQEKAQAVQVEQISKELERDSALQEIQARFTEKLRTLENQLGSQSSTRDYSTMEQSVDARLSMKQESWSRELALATANFEAQTEQINKKIFELQEVFQADQI